MKEIKKITLLYTHKGKKNTRTITINHDIHDVPGFVHRLLDEVNKSTLDRIADNLQHALF